MLLLSALFLEEVSDAMLLFINDNSTSSSHGTLLATHNILMFVFTKYYFVAISTPFIPLLIFIVSSDVILA